MALLQLEVGGGYSSVVRAPQMMLMLLGCLGSPLLAADDAALARYALLSRSIAAGEVTKERDVPEQVGDPAAWMEARRLLLLQVMERRGRERDRKDLATTVALAAKQMPPALPSPLLEGWGMLLLRQQYPEAACAWFAAAGTQAANDSTRVLCALGLAQAWLTRKDPDQANRYLALVDGWLARLSEDDEAKGLRDRRNNLGANVVDVRDEMVHGLPYLRLREGNALRQCADFTGAQAKYDEVLALVAKDGGRSATAGAPIYRAYAQYGKALTALDSGDARSARLAAMPILADAEHPFHGDAMLLQADLRFADEGPTAAVVAEYQAAETWFRDVQGRLSDLSARRPEWCPPAPSLERVRPQADMRRYDEWGNATWSEEQSDRLYVPAVCPWYLSYRRHMAFHRLVAVAACAGRVEDGLAALRAALPFDALDQQVVARKGISNFRRLAAGVRAGRFWITPEELAMFPSGLRPWLYLAEVDFEAERWDQSIAWYRRIQRQASERLTQPQQAYLAFAQAVALVYRGAEDQEYRSLIAPFFASGSPWKRTRSYWRMLYVARNLHEQDSERYLREGAEQFPDPDARAEFHLVLGQNAYGKGDRVRAVGWFRSALALATPVSYERARAISFLRLCGIADLPPMPVLPIHPE